MTYNITYKTHQHTHPVLNVLGAYLEHQLRGGVGVVGIELAPPEELPQGALGCQWQGRDAALCVGGWGGGSEWGLGGALAAAPRQARTLLVNDHQSGDFTPTGPRRHKRHKYTHTYTPWCAARAAAPRRRAKPDRSRRRALGPPTPGRCPVCVRACVCRWVGGWVGGWVCVLV
jgi:hypothetical protein